MNRQFQKNLEFVALAVAVVVIIYKLSIRPHYTQIYGIWLMLCLTVYVIYDELKAKTPTVQQL